MVKRIHLQRRRPGFNSWVGISPGEENGNSLQYSCLGNPIERGAWKATVHGVAKELDTNEQINNNIQGPAIIFKPLEHLSLDPFQFSSV